MTHDWREDVFVSTRCYAYQGALYCEECGRRLIKFLGSKEDSGDSSDYPQGPYLDGGGEADAPQFCDSGEYCPNAFASPGRGVRKSGCPLGNPLTSDGIKYVNNTVRTLVFAYGRHLRALGRLEAYLYGRGGHDVITPEALEVPIKTLDNVSRDLEEKVEGLGLADLGENFYVDPEYVYCSGQKKTGEVVLARIELSPDGGFGKPDVALLPAGEASRPQGEVMAAAIEEMAWD